MFAGQTEVTKVRLGLRQQVADMGYRRHPLRRLEMLACKD